MRSIDNVRAHVLRIRSPSGAIARVAVARTFIARGIGLLGRARLAADEGLLLVPGGTIHTAWMRFAIDVVFLSEQLIVLKVAQHVRPWRVVSAPRGTCLVLELPAGAAHATGITCNAALVVAKHEQRA